MPPYRCNVLCLSPYSPTDPDPSWIDPDDYQALLAYSAGAQSARGRPLSAPSSQTYVLAAGMVSGAGEVEFVPAWQVTTSDPPENPPAGDTYCLGLRGAGDAVLQSHYFKLAIPLDYLWGGFLVASPLTADATRVVLVKGATEWAEIPASLREPSVAIHSATQSEPATAGMSLTWSGSDSDGDALSYSVLYSGDDRATWLPVSTNITRTEYTLDLSEVPAGQQAWVRVEASDGFYTAGDEWGPFVVEDHTPTAVIFHPEPGSVVSAALRLWGYGYDVDDGKLDGPATCESGRTCPLGGNSEAWGPAANAPPPVRGVGRMGALPGSPERRIQRLT